ncbi:serine/threonine-protein kinase [Paucibacter sp. Y2R2-4]|uniref:serine/threonine-protein kinase n=1 Tax=Paucibacter sp. Y2R2-4 TaxID=2893553 RepID=UPI0021E4487C|nr:serine/threonine-protein kinase [Paucibacter sp. Y2R2-4]MCV2350765.1 protein kinase [Paucibacter sp. Y2R2-4]
MSDARRDIDKARWPLLSPLLDELLDLPAEQRGARLRELHAQSPEGPALAADLQELLRRQDALEAADYLATPALQQMEQHAAAAVPSNSPGQQIGSYTLEREIGQGGMGTVWLARRTDGRFEGLVAIKFLNAGLLGHGDAGRFTREGQILGKLAHPHIARLLDAGVNTALGPAQAQPYLVLEYVDGQPLDRYCESASLDIRARVTLFLDVLAAVAHAHTRLILHRDLKPSNILVNTAGEVKLLDFGIAKLLHQPGDGDDSSSSSGAATELTRQAGRAFTPRYAAPEQVEGGEVTTATDVYALGVLLYLLLSGGQHPTQQRDDERTTPLERLRTVVEVEPKKLSERARSARRADSEQYAGGQSSSSKKEARARAKELRGDLDTIVAKTLKKAPAERYANAAELAEDLRHWLNHEPISARPDSAAYILAKFVRRHRLAVAAGSLGLLTLSVSIGVALRQGQEAQAQRAQAEGLIEFMLGDLRKKLEPVGRLDVLDAVGEKALGYYAAQQTGRLDADALGQRARALHLMGQIAQQRGKLDEASRMYDAAAGSTAELLQRAPKDGQRIYDHAQSVFWLGEAAWRQGQTDEAEKQFKRYLELAEQLGPLATGKPDWLAERANAGSNLGVLQVQSGKAEAALQSFQKALAVYQELSPSQPDLQIEVVNTLGWIANAQKTLGNYVEAIQAERAKLTALSQIPGAANDRQLQLLEANSHHEISRSQFFLGQTEAARLASEQAVARLQALSQVDKGNLEWVERYSTLRLGLAEIRLASGETQLGPFLVELQNDIERLLASDAKQLRWQCDLRGRLLDLRAQIEQTEAQRRSLAGEMQRYLADMQALGQTGSRFNQPQRWVLARVALNLGHLLAETDVALAQRYWAQAAQQVREDVTQADAQAMAVSALAQFRLGRIAEARALAEKLEASSYRHPDLIRLRTLLQEGATRNTRLTGNPKP